MKDIEKINYSSLEFMELSKTFNSRYIAQGVLWKMENMFQLSIELYDSKSDSVIWSDRWQENWNSLTQIKGKLCDGLLKALNIESKDSEKIETFSSEAYKNYLEAFFIWGKRENEADVLRSRKLLKRAIELDKNFLGARAWLAWTFLTVGEYDLAFDYFKIIKQDAEEIGDTRNLIRALHGLGEIYVVRDNNTKRGYPFSKNHYHCQKVQIRSMA